MERSWPLALDTLLLRHRNHYPLLTDPPTTTIHPANLWMIVLLSSLFVEMDLWMSEEQFDWDSFWNVIAMKNEAVELGRELGGLLLVTGWMAMLA